MSKARDTLDALTRTNAPDDGKTYVRQYDQWQQAPITGYALLDFGTIGLGTTYTRSNPFGTAPVIVMAEIAVNGTWLREYWIYVTGSGGYGYRCNVDGDTIYLRTGIGYLSSTSTNIATPHVGITTATDDVKFASCRVHVWRLAD